MESIRSSETTLHTLSTRRHIPEHPIIHSHSCGNLKFYKYKNCLWSRPGKFTALHNNKASWLWWLFLSIWPLRLMWFIAYVIQPISSLHTTTAGYWEMLWHQRNSGNDADPRLNFLHYRLKLLIRLSVGCMPQAHNYTLKACLASCEVGSFRRSCIIEHWCAMLGIYLSLDTLILHYALFLFHSNLEYIKSMIRGLKIYHVLWIIFYVCLAQNRLCTNVYFPLQKRMIT
jgi:hypothetical protein